MLLYVVNELHIIQINVESLRLFWKIVNKYNIFEQKQNITYIYKNQYKIWTIIVEKEFFNSNLQIKNI